MDDEGFYNDEEIYTKDQFNYIAEKNKCPIDFNSLKIDSKVKEEAKIIYFELIKNSQAKRVTKVNHLKFSCIFYAHQRLGIPVQPRDIASSLGMSGENMKAALRRYNELETGYRPYNIEVTVEDLLKIYCEKLNISEKYEDVLIVSNRVFEKDPHIVATRMKQISAASLLLYFLRINGITFKDKKQETIMADLCYKSEATLKVVAKKIFTIDNS
uniref:Transcription initiation factor IIB n=1 Tax=Pithovirus LCPAC403 TaxID=2506596 RepID=A0A481ZBT9_9VIRU|nr:MAG: transcription initiation factor IIB [Pithovirus LCPAC403]